MHVPLLADLVVLLVVSIVVLYISHFIGLPPIVGFLLSGVLLGPDGLRLVRALEEVEQLAEIGVVLLLFTIGLEFSLADLLRMRRSVLLGGSVQLIGVTAVVALVAVAAGLPSNGALFLGMIASLSSTAVVLRLLQQTAEIDAPHGRMSMAILVFQDLMVVPMMLMIPVLAGSSRGLAFALGSFVLQAVAVVAVVLVLGRHLVPRLLDRVVRTRDRDLFLLSVVTLCLAIAWIASLAGLSLALGAFLAGLVVSESEYSHQALADILPFRDLFAAFFFISIGMLLDLELAFGQPLVLLGLVAGVLAIKAVAATAASILVGGSLRSGVATGMTMSQVGEFSFVLAGAGLAAGLMPDVTYQWFVAAAVASIGLTPFMVRAAPATTRLLGGVGFLEPSEVRRDDVPDTGSLENHLVVIGYGVNGRNVVRAAGVAGIPYVAVDLDPTLVAAERARGMNLHYGDATRQALLAYVGVRRARAVVVALSDAAVTRQVTALTRALNAGCTIVARTRYVREVEALLELGADTVIPEELETSVEIVSRVLASYLVPRHEIDTFVSELRAGGYEMWRTSVAGESSMLDLKRTLSEVEVTTLRVDPRSRIAGQRLGDSDLRRLYGVTVVAIRRGEELVPNPGGGELIQPRDQLVMLGLGEEIAAASALVMAADEEVG